MRTSRTLAAVTLATVATFALGACGGGAPETADTAAAPAPTTTEVPADTPTTVAADPNAFEPVSGLVANSDNDVAVFANIDDATPASTLPATTEFGSRRVFAVVGWQGPDGEWLEVLLPERPNSSRGFVRSTDVTLTQVDYRVAVDLGARQLRVFDGDDVMVETPIAIGSDENPTPTGEFYLTDILSTGDPDSAYGLYALGLSAHSLSLSEFAGGDGQIGIHGTNQPSSIGQNVSHGCVRVPNDVVVALANTLPLGTPVTIS